MAPQDLPALFAEDGALARALGDFRHRPQQVEFARAVLDTIEAAGTLIAEAGTGEDARDLQKIRVFAARTMHGDKSECADVAESSGAWSQATSTRENCLGSRCRHYDECFVMKARRRAAEADVIVVNHHLFFAD